MISRLLILPLFLASCLFSISHIQAQSIVESKETKSVPISTKVKRSETENGSILDQIANWRGILLSNEQALARNGMSDDDLLQKVAETSAVRLKAIELELIIAPQVKQIQDQLDQLGPVPKEGEPAESDAISIKRKELGTIFSTLDGELKASRLIIVRASQIETLITNKRRQIFVTQLSQRSKSFFDIQLWQNFWKGTDGFLRRFNLLITESFKVMSGKINSSILLVPLLFGGLMIIAGTTMFLRLNLKKKIDRILTDSSELPIGGEVKIQLASASFMKNGIIPTSSIILLFLLFSMPGILTDRLENLILDFVFILIASVVALVLAKIFLAPDNAARRFTLLPDTAAIRISNIITCGVILIGSIRLFNKTAVVLASPFDVSIALRALLALTCFVSISLVLTTIAAVEKAPDEPTEVKINFVRWGYINPLLWMGCIFGAIALAAGYLAFAEFLVWQILIGTIVFAILWLCMEFLDLHRDQYLDIENGKWRKLANTTGFSQQIIMQGSVFGFGLMKLSAVLAAATIFFISWGYRTGNWAETVSQLYFGFRIGGLNISLSAIALAIVTFISGYIITRAIQNWLRVQFLPITTLEHGLRNSIAIVFGYAGIVFALLLAVSAAGFDLSNIAIIAGALSVGIGFGLQSIVNNFFSGLILLAERPIKAGDWIITSGGQGTVTKTSVRSTEIETFDGATVIIPNSTLITEAVTNWTHHNKRGRIIISIGVGYDSDPEQVREILFECAEDSNKILKKPGPVVYFMDFGADALIFELRGYLSDINYSLSVKSDLRFSIINALRKANIEIPYPQRDIHIKTSSGDLGDLSVRSAKAKKK